MKKWEERQRKKHENELRIAIRNGIDRGGSKLNVIIANACWRKLDEGIHDSTLPKHFEPQLKPNISVQKEIKIMSPPRTVATKIAFNQSGNISSSHVSIKNQTTTTTNIQIQNTMTTTIAAELPNICNNTHNPIPILGGMIGGSGECQVDSSIFITGNGCTEQHNKQCAREGEDIREGTGEGIRMGDIVESVGVYTNNSQGECQGDHIFSPKGECQGGDHIFSPKGECQGDHIFGYEMEGNVDQGTVNHIGDNSVESVDCFSDNHKCVGKGEGKSDKRMVDGIKGGERGSTDCEYRVNECVLNPYSCNNGSNVNLDIQNTIDKILSNCDDTEHLTKVMVSRSKKARRIAACQYRTPRFKMKNKLNREKFVVNKLNSESLYWDSQKNTTSEPVFARPFSIVIDKVIARRVSPYRPTISRRGVPSLSCKVLYDNGVEYKVMTNNRNHNIESLPSKRRD